MNGKQIAFTLIELLVVIAIIGILSGLIVVTMNGVTSKANIAKSQVFSNSLRNALMANLISDWNFDGIGVSDGNSATAAYFLDTWGQNNGSVTATPPTVLSGSNCVFASCLYFNGSQYVSIADNPVFNFGNQMTIMIWIKGGAGSTRTFISNWENTVVNKGSWWLGTNTNTPYNKLRVAVSDDGSYNSTHCKQYYTTSIIADDSWHYVGFTFNNGILKLYIDGVDAEVIKTWDPAITSIYNTDVDLNISAYLSSGSPAGYFTGRIDEVRLYSAAMPISQIKEQYYAGLNSLLFNGGMSFEEYKSRLSEYGVVD